MANTGGTQIYNPLTLDKVEALSRCPAGMSAVNNCCTLKIKFKKL